MKYTLSTKKRTDLTKLTTTRSVGTQGAPPGLYSFPIGSKIYKDCLIDIYFYCEHLLKLVSWSMNCLQTKFAGVRESGGVEDIPINSLPYKIIIYIIPQLSTQYASEGEITIFVVLDSFIKYIICL